MKVKVGDRLAHPAHGVMTVTNVGPATYEEFIPSIQAYEKGFRVEAVFDRFIPGVKWNASDGKGGRISMLIFHSWYLSVLKKV